MSVIILGIETSCDETSAAVLADGVELRSNVIASQVDIHKKFGGVVPEVASRKHLENLHPVILEALAQAGVTPGELSAVAVTYGPGLVGALLVGVAAAKAMAYALDIPLIGVNHLEGHIAANFLVRPDLEFPLLCLVVSGGHSDLVYLPHRGDYRLLGRTRDDAAGEAFDKVARALGLDYPGGPLIDQLAQQGDPRAVQFPLAFLEEGSLDFSFSGLKSAVLNYLNRAAMLNQEINRADLAAGFQRAVVEVLVEKTMLAAQKTGVKTIMLAGGVAANRGLRELLQARAAAAGCRVVLPPLHLCTDNAAMIACAGYYKYLRGDFAPLTLNAVPSLTLGQDKY
ncbi:tRNA (adenosine(37)-N6)-threonylcarbamoyltransferase complex transferase subunit TsaD [Desulforamulus hydrothermalis]|uniref:tRNA N6-adenosine threonylcarbamoyltransferase n=1 Tax=Desulforamulus hydrothermalis Lam5 = DSM 18033 TaxID=1121428 RepID=K8E963_9FIRM|nr:tRNA (adenosine(37)-N6)-threonylcarbamoyltransferase complex transferase subunit TsaD [Desulforamulus hydrothermalis]CCO08078.1 O-sialoglycoprotein endopeptidase [Desulforamulus hydrothermalis Lam5 = DSM 18033]SHG82521.1 O-sialoglycoprotein endopeptidase [Desulforamulus hydrothermalis Lam5 = DSM 18033]